MAKYDIEVKLSGQDGNVFNLISICVRSMIKNKVDGEEIILFKHEVMNSGSYDNSLAIMQEWLVIN